MSIGGIISCLRRPFLVLAALTARTQVKILAITILLSGLTVCGRCGAEAGIFPAGRYTMLNVIPYSPGREDKVAEDVREYVRRTGNRFVLYRRRNRPAAVEELSSDGHWQSAVFDWSGGQTVIRGAWPCYGIRVIRIW